jgi:hypothetical protein
MKRHVLELDPATYRRHLIHGEGRRWAETNCYVDLWIELLHALGREPIAALPFTFAIDFEGDQWTFFKFPLADLYELYGLDVQELAIWRPLVQHVDEHVGRGRPVLVELDSYYLPDTAGTAYKQAHVKTTVAAVEIDIEARHLGYFHNQGYFRLSGDDFTDIFRLRGQPDPATLPPYVEFVKLRDDARPPDAELPHISLRLLRKQLALAPKTNPFGRFKTQLTQDLEWLIQGSIEDFHLYSFATLRQYGACYELCATYLRWLEQHGQTGLADTIAAFDALSENAKVFQFQLARAVNRKKRLDLAPVDEMGTRWEHGLSALKTRFL